MTVEEAAVPRFAHALRTEPALYHSYAVAQDGLSYVVGRVWSLLEGRTARVLDAGAGSGRYALALARRGARVAAAEAAAEAVRHARGLAAADGGRPVDPVQAACPRLPFRDAAFDAAVCFAPVLAGGREPALLAEELERVVRPGGRVVVAGNALGDEFERLLPSGAAAALREAEERLAATLRRRGYREETVATAFVFATVDEAERTMGALLGPQAAAYIGSRLMYDHVSPTVAHRVRLLWTDVG